MKKILLIIFASILMISNGFAQTASLVIPDNFAGTSGNVANVPVTFSGLSANLVTGLDIRITFDPAMVTFLQLVNVSATLTADGTVDYGVVNGNQINANWLDSDVAGIFIPDNTVLWEYQFIANAGGTCPLDFVFVEIIDVSFNPYAYTSDNGSVVFGAPASTTTWNGTGPWYTFGNWSAGIPGSATQAYIASGVVTVDGSPAHSNNLTVNPGAGLTINTSRILNVNGNFILESNTSAAPTGALILNGTLNVTGIKSVKRFLTAGVQHFISIPVITATINDLYNASNPGYLFRFLEPTNAWDNPWDLGFVLNVATGYSVNYTNPETVSFEGMLNNDAAYSPTLTRLGNGWNFVGNPYQAPLDWELGTSGWTKTNLDSTYYVWNNTTYASYNSQTGVGINDGSRYIPVMQGFFVHSSAGSPAFSIKKAARTHAGNTTLFMKNKEEIPNVFRMSITNGILGEETAICLIQDATNEFDPGYDAYKLFGFNQEAPHIYTFLNNIEYAVNSIPMADVINLPVRMKASQSGSFEISASGFETFTSNYYFILEDTEAGDLYDLKEAGTVSLYLNEGESADRFILHIYKSSLGIGDEALAPTHIYSVNKNIYLANCPKSEVSVFNMQGSAILSQELPEASLNCISLSAASGIYVVKVTTETGAVSSKVFIK